MSSGFMVGSHEARLAHVRSGQGTREPWTSIHFFFFFFS